MIQQSIEKKGQPTTFEDFGFGLDLGTTISRVQVLPLIFALRDQSCHVWRPYEVLGIKQITHMPDTFYHLYYAPSLQGFVLR